MLDVQGVPLKIWVILLPFCVSIFPSKGSDSLRNSRRWYAWQVAKIQLVRRYIIRYFGAMLKRWTREFAHMAWFFDPQLQFIDSFRCAVKEIEVAACALWAIVFDGKSWTRNETSFVLKRAPEIEIPVIERGFETPNVLKHRTWNRTRYGTYTPIWIGVLLHYTMGLIRIDWGERE